MNSESSYNDNETIAFIKKYYKVFLLILVCVIGFWLICACLILLPSKWCFISIPEDISSRGQFGDSFNIVTSFISVFTLTFLIIGLIYQHIQLSTYKKDSEQQQKFTNKQSFENTLFQMLSFHNDVVNSTKITISKQTISSEGNSTTDENMYGRDCFKYFYSCLKQYYESYSSFDTFSIPIELEHIKDAFGDLYSAYGQHIGHYFRRLFGIFRYLDDCKFLETDEKYDYARIVKAQMSNFEIKLLFYNALTPLGSDFVKYINDYKLLKGIITEQLLTPEHWDLAKGFCGSFWEERVNGEK